MFLPGGVTTPEISCVHLSTGVPAGHLGTSYLAWTNALQISYHWSPRCGRYRVSAYPCVPPVRAHMARRVVFLKIKAPLEVIRQRLILPRHLLISIQQVPTMVTRAESTDVRPVKQRILSAVVSAVVVRCTHNLIIVT